MTESMLDVPTVAKRLQCSPKKVRELIREGRLDSVDIAPARATRRNLRIPESSLVALIQSPESVGPEITTR